MADSGATVRDLKVGGDQDEEPQEATKKAEHEGLEPCKILKICLPFSAYFMLLFAFGVYGLLSINGLGVSQSLLSNMSVTRFTHPSVRFQFDPPFYKPDSVTSCIIFGACGAIVDSVTLVQSSNLPSYSTKNIFFVRISCSEPLRPSHPQHDEHLFGR